VLLDRQRVKFWQKWVFGFMAVIMAGFLVMIPLSNNMGCGGATTATQQLDKDIAKYQAAVKADPKNVESLRVLAQSYALRANAQQPGSAAEQADLRAAAQYYERAAKLLSKQKGAAAKQLRLDTLQQLVTAYISLKDLQAATGVYGRITALTPNDATAFAEMATVAMNGGDVATALLAWSRYLKLDPKAPDAQAVKDWIAANSGVATPTPTPKPSSSPGGGQ
jgi:tetratricopeptide (TPR) repeat protein